MILIKFNILSKLTRCLLTENIENIDNYTYKSDNVFNIKFLPGWSLSKTRPRQELSYLALLIVQSFHKVVSDEAEL